MKLAWPLMAALAILGCGSSAEEPADSADAAVPLPDASDAGSTPDADATPPDAAGPSTAQYDPCASAACWAARALGACGSATLNESFSSGLYGVHHYLLMAPAGALLELTAKRTAGSWSPVLIVHDEQGTTVHDGDKSQSSGALTVSALPASADSVGVRLTAATRMHLAVYLTGASVVASGFSDLLPTDAKYSLTLSASCTPPAPLYVRGVKLNAKQELWVRYIGEHVVPKVPGSASERIDKSAYVTWWALKEGVLDVNNPLSYSNCSIPPDEHLGPIEVCPNPNNAWQVGLSGVQAAYRTLADTEKLALSVLPQQSLGEMLVDAGVTAGFGVKTSLGQSIAGSQDRLRLSWLLRNAPVGFEAQYSPVHDQCFVSQKSWCFGTGWPSSASFAPDQAGAKLAVADLKQIFQNLAP